MEINEILTKVQTQSESQAVSCGEGGAVSAFEEKD
jgi:hypothetical protein